MADDDWAVFEGFEKTAFEQQHSFKPRISHHREIRDRFEALNDEERDDRVSAIRGLQSALSVLNAAENAAEQALLYNGREDPSEGKSLGAYVAIQDTVWRAARDAEEQHKTLVATLAGESYYVADYLADVLKELGESQKFPQDFVVADPPDQRTMWRRRLESRKRRALALKEPGWSGYWKIGEGGFGSADLWVKQNTHGKVIDRVVVKDTMVDDDLWADSSLWVNGLAGQEGSVPTEIQSLYNMRPRIGSSSVLKIRNWRIQRELQLYRTYTEFCSRGDAFGLIKAANVYGQHPRFKDKNNDVSGDGPLVPEPLLWFLFETLTKACLLMERGELDAKGPAPWDLIIHRDMKLMNIFFGSNTSGVYRGYPEGKLGDFGLSIIAPSKSNPVKKDGEGNDIERMPNEIPRNGTQGHVPPEQWQMLRSRGRGTGGRALLPMTTRTNVWGVGILMFSLVACEDGLSDNFEGKGEAAYDNSRNWKVPGFDRSAQAYYSKELLGLIRHCLEYEPEKRPDPDDVMRVIRRNTAPGKNDKSDGMRLADADDVRFRTDHGVAFVKADRYTPGTDLWAWNPPEGSAAVPDAPDELDELAPGEEDALGGDPGGAIGPVGASSGGHDPAERNDDGEQQDEESAREDPPDPPPPAKGRGRRKRKGEDEPKGNPPKRPKQGKAPPKSKRPRGRPPKNLKK